MTNFNKVSAWLKDAGQTTEHFNAQVACDMEEMGEYLEALGDAMDFPPQSHIGLMFSAATNLIDLISSYVRSLNGVGLFNKLIEAPPYKKTKLLDAICDREVTANGVAYMLGFDKNLADQLVQDSNNSKLLVDADGNRYARRNGDGKIIKPESFAPVDLSGCVGGQETQAKNDSVRIESMEWRKVKEEHKHGFYLLYNRITKHGFVCVGERTEKSDYWRELGYTDILQLPELPPTY